MQSGRSPAAGPPVQSAHGAEAQSARGAAAESAPHAAPRTATAIGPPPRAVREAPECCSLCSAAGQVRPLDFEQLYPQADALPVRLHWWRCNQCGGWFVSPMPRPEVIAGHWPTVPYASESSKWSIGQKKEALFHRILWELAQRGPVGQLLDVGCNYGVFLDRAREAGWSPRGQEPNAVAGAHCRRQGFDARSAWDLADCRFMAGQFQAITVVDAFCYSLAPLADLRLYERLLRPGGHLVMRLTNKHAVLRFLHTMVRSPARRSALLTDVLLGQFHSAPPNTLRRILRDNGFDEVTIISGATTTTNDSLRWSSRLAYGGAELVRRLSLGRVNISPGILLLARKHAEASAIH